VDPVRVQMLGAMGAPMTDQILRKHGQVTVSDIARQRSRNSRPPRRAKAAVSRATRAKRSATRSASASPRVMGGAGNKSHLPSPWELPISIRRRGGRKLVLAQRWGRGRLWPVIAAAVGAAVALHEQLESGSVRLGTLLRAASSNSRTAGANLPDGSQRSVASSSSLCHRCALYCL
jgi:hypothetical protein